MLRGVCKKMSPGFPFGRPGDYLFTYLETSFLSDADELHDDVDGEADDERELEHVAEERRHLDAALLGNRLHHEVRAVADVGEGSEEDGTY